jgi:4-carboxymuconolactone decarboxylase
VTASVAPIKAENLVGLGGDEMREIDAMGQESFDGIEDTIDSPECESLPCNFLYCRANEMIFYQHACVQPMGKAVRRVPYRRQFSQPELSLMARIPLIEEREHPELAGLIAKIRGGLQGRLLNVYRTMLHTPDLVAVWLDYMGAVRWKTEIDGRLREIAIIRIAHLNRARYSMRQHVPKVALAEGLTLDECDALADWQASRFFSKRERDVLAYADSMTRDVQVPDAIFEAVRAHFNHRQLVELTMLIAAYNMQNRVVEALDVDLEPLDPANRATSTKS